MAELRFDFDWEDPQAAKGRALRSTWSRLEVRIGGEPVTRLFDPSLEAVRDYVWMPLYPLAEWIASNWWSLLYEAASSAPRSRFRQRHDIRFAGDGFVLPELSFITLGSEIQARWTASKRTDWPGEFIGSGSALISSPQAEEELRRLVDAVVHRLEESEIQDTYLQQEWARVQRLEPEQIDFCRATAALGLDPFSLTDEETYAVLKSHEILQHLPGLGPETEWEILQSADPGLLLDQIEALRRAEEVVAAGAIPTNGLGRLSSTPSPGMPPWNQGYQMARELRAELSALDRIFRGFDDVSNVLSERTLPVLDIETRDLFDALVVRRSGSELALGMSSKKTGEAMRTFALTRAVGEFLTLASPPSAATGLVTAGQTEHQKRNRAFAAEFLAPAHLLQCRLRSGIASAELIEDLASEFSVSPMVIEHQLHNHHLVDRIEH